MHLTSDIIQAFGATGKPQKLAGGEGNSFLVDGLVFKPVLSEQETNWRCEMFSTLEQNGFQLADPVQTLNGHWNFKGWEASKYVEGQTVKGRWGEKIIISRKFHTALKDIQKPSFLGTALHPWGIADRMIWGEQELVYSDRLRGVMDPLKKLLKPIQLPAQVIHGDMAGNILFPAHGDPIVIDFSPYWRPAEFATAILIVDAVVWEGAPDSILSEMDGVTDGKQLLVRAAMWRIKTTEEYLRQYGKGDLGDVDAYQHLIDLLN